MKNKILFLVMILITTNLFSQVISNEAFSLSNSFGDLLMRRYISGDLTFKRALVPSATQLHMNWAGDFSEGVRVQGSKFIVDGNVGIGTTSPSETLDVNGNISISSTAYSNKGFVLDRQNYGSKWKIWSESTGLYHDWSDDNFTTKTRSLFLKNTGEVGIGTVSPSYLLEVGNNSNSTNLFKVNGISSDVTYNGTHIGPVWSYINSGTGPGTRFYVEDANNAPERLTFNFKGNSGAINILAGTSNGNVGIGTSSPSRRIEVGDKSSDFSAFGRFNGSWVTDFEKHARIEFNDQNFGIGAGAMTNDSETDDDLYLWSYNGEGRDISFLSTSNGNSDPSTWSHNMIIKGTNGFVGIGTTSPKSKLSVDGQIRATEVKVLTDISVPDYVFEPDYELRTLKEIKDYITENKHLPEIPSGAEISENGIDLGDMNMRLLKKIEELTLYTISQEKKINNLEKENEVLKSLASDLATLKADIEKLKSKE